MENGIQLYTEKLIRVLEEIHEHTPLIDKLKEALKDAWIHKRKVFICGNGGSAGNAVHLANDFNYGIDGNGGIGLRVEALPANTSVITCLANDEGYDSIFSQQLKVKADSGDILIVFSGSGNSPNVIKALEVANDMGMKTFAILGFSGGKCKELAQFPIHIVIDDMQISEDMQVIIGHMCMQWLHAESLKG
jgi:D-sedoheptulose 7-phosphate isomerase